MARKLVSNNEYQSSWPLALTWAARMGHIEVVKPLVKLGISPKDPLLDGRAAFSWAVAGGYLNIVDMFLVRNDCPIDVPDDSPINVPDEIPTSVQDDNRINVRDNSLINIRDENGCSPLILATQYQHLDILDRLLATPGIDINQPNNQGAVAFNLAICGSNPTVREMAIFHKLLHNPAVDITLRDDLGRTCLSYLAEFDATEAIQALLDCDSRTHEVLKLLNDRGDNNGDSPLTHAACKGHARTVRLLCQTHNIEAQLHSVDVTDGATIFHLAARSGHVDIIRLLAEYYPRGVNSRDAAGRTPLSTAREEGSEDVVRALMECGADVDPVSIILGNR